MARYHVRADGSMGVCTAKEGNCPFGGEEGTKHFTSESEARSYSEKIVAGQSRSSKGLKRSNGGGGSKVPPTGGNGRGTASGSAGGDPNRTAEVSAGAYLGLDPSYDPEEYDAADANRLYDADLSIMRQANDNARKVLQRNGSSGFSGYTSDIPHGKHKSVAELVRYTLSSDIPLYAEDSQGRGPVIVMPEEAKKDLGSAFGYVNQGLLAVEAGNPDDEYDEEFSTYFAKPDSYVRASFNDDYATADFGGIIRKVDPDSEEADRILKSDNYIEVADAFAEFEQTMKDEGTTFGENEEDFLYDDSERNGRFMANRIQTSALAWALHKYPNSSGALMRRDEIYVLR